MDDKEREMLQRRLIEEIGMYFDKKGFQPIAGRIKALLMVMDKECFTFDEIVEELNISKSSASNALKNLEIRGDIEYITLPGDRKRYFQIKKNDRLGLIEEFEAGIASFRTFIDKIVELKGDKTSSNSIFFIEILDMIDFFSTRLNN